MNDMTLYVNNTTNQMHRKPEKQSVLRQVLTNSDISLCVSSPHKLATNHSTLMTYILRFITRFLIKISNNRHWIKEVASVRKLGYKMDLWNNVPFLQTKVTLTLYLIQLLWVALLELCKDSCISGSNLIWFLSNLRIYR